jgi:hypothetical protein
MPGAFLATIRPPAGQTFTLRRAGLGQKQGTFALRRGPLVSRHRAARRQDWNTVNDSLARKNRRIVLAQPDRHNPAAFCLGPAWLAGRRGGGESYF